MSGQKKTYEEILKDMCPPVDIATIPNRKIDYKALLAYARARGLRVNELPMETRNKFVVANGIRQ